MANTVRLETQLKQKQTLNMTQEMRQSIELLQKNQVELREMLLEKVNENHNLEVADWGDEPLEAVDNTPDGDVTEPEQTESSEESGREKLEKISDVLNEYNWNRYKEDNGNSFGDTHVRKKNDYSHTYTLEDTVPETESLTTHLDFQVSGTSFPEEIKEIMTYMVYNINEKGFLEENDSEIAQTTGVSVHKVSEARKNLMYLDPPGTAAANFESYLKFMFLELPGKNKNSKIRKNIELLLSDDSNLNALRQQNFMKICKDMGIKKDAMKDILSAIRTIAPYPAYGYDHFRPEYAVPDLHVHLINDETYIEIENKFLPDIRIIDDEQHAEEMDMVKNRKDRDFMKKQYKSAQWLVKSLKERNQTLYQVASSIFRLQKDFLRSGEQFLKPLKLKDVSDDIGRHQSTVSRLTNGKFAMTKHGIYELKSFFVKEVNKQASSITTNRHLETRITEIIDKEIKEKPFSDDDIAHLLKKEGIKVARRTVAKYRKKLNILSARERKRDYEFYNDEK